MGENVDGGVLPCDQFAVHPNVFDRFHAPHVATFAAHPELHGIDG
jgi:hypothetical protein